MTTEMDFLERMNVSRETMENLKEYVELIRKWTKSINLIASASVEEIWSRHITDSAQIYSKPAEDWSSWTDIGSGAGLPALVIAIMDEQRRPIRLIESDRRKCLFLNTVRRELDLNVEVIVGRIGEQKIERADVVSARALAPLSQLLSFSEELLKPEGTAIFPKGERYQEELDQARMEWQFDIKSHPSVTKPDARILEISRIERRER